MVKKTEKQEEKEQEEKQEKEETVQNEQEQQEKPKPQESTVKQDTEVKTPSLEETIKVVNKQFEDKLTKVQAELTKEIQERDKIIAQLLTTDKKDETPKANPYVDEINSRRKFNQW